MRHAGWLAEVLREARELADKIPEYRRGDDVTREIRKIEARRANAPRT